MTDAETPRGPTILVVDDEIDVRALVRDVLSRDGYHVIETGDPFEARRIAETQPVHLLLTDVVMPIMSGIDLADGTFYNIGLNDNGWVTVTYLWTEGGGDTKSFPTWGTDVSIRQQATTASTRVATLSGPTTVRVKCQVHGRLVDYQGYGNDAWSSLPDLGGCISDIFIDIDDAWLPGVFTC